MATDVIITLKNGDEQITLNQELLVSGVPAPGYHLVSYQPAPPPIETARNSSLYADGSTIVNYKAGNVVETLVVNILGSSTADAFDKLRALQRLAWSARDYHTAPNNRYPSNMSLRQRGLSTAVFAVLYNAQVNETNQSGRANTDANYIKNVTITIEREPYWRSHEPVPSAFTTYFTFGAGGTTNGITRPAWGALAFDGGATNLQLVAGDVPALIRLVAAGINGQAIGNLVVGYKSQKRHSIPSAFTPTTTPIVHEAENFAIADGVYTSTALFTTASPYPNQPGGAGQPTGMRVAEDAVNRTRILAGVGIDVHTYRVFARMAMSGTYLTEYASVQMQQTGVGNIGPAVSVVGSSWAMYDMGIVTPPISEPQEWNATPYSTTIQISLASQHINVTGIGLYLHIDCFVLIPCDEYYIHNTTPNAAVYNNIMTPPTDVNTIGQLLLPPGAGQLYWLMGDTSFINFYQAGTNYTQMYLAYNNRYGGPRGS